MIGTEISLFTAVVIVWGLPFALKVKQAVVAMVDGVEEKSGTDRERSDRLREPSVEKVELVYLPVLIFFFLQDMSGAMIVSVLGFLIHAVYMSKLSPLGNVRLSYTPQVQRLTGTVYLAGGLIMMAAIVFAAFWTIAAGLALMIITIWSVHPLVKAVQNTLTPVEEHVRKTAIEDAVRLLTVSEGTALILLDGIDDPERFEAELEEQRPGVKLFSIEGEDLTVYEVARQINSGPVAGGDWIPVYANRLRDSERELLVQELKPDWSVQVTEDKLLIQSVAQGKWRTVLDQNTGQKEAYGFSAEQLILLIASESGD